MKQIFLGGKHGSIIGNYALVDDADYEWLNQWKWTARKPATGNTIYAERNHKNGCASKMHRLILGLTDLKIFGDHEDGNGLNNQRYNLRECTRNQNTMNARSQQGSSQYKGVDFVARLNKWRAQIQYNKTKVFIGLYLLESEAALAYNEAAIKHHGEFARLNIIMQSNQ